MSKTFRLGWLVVCLSLMACPPAVSPDAGAPVFCNNNVLDPLEACEGFELRGASCESLGFTAGLLGCSSSCAYETSACTNCGNGVLERGEACDGPQSGEQTCASVLGSVYTGSLGCSPDCQQVLVTGCTTPVPMGPLQGCTLGAATACQAGLTCTATASGSFCITPCSSSSSTCGPDSYCQDVGDAGACAPRPTRAQGCSAESGCSSAHQTCTPTFIVGTTSVSTCAVTCPGQDVNTGSSTCAAGERCAPSPGGQLQFEHSNACTATNEATVCDTALGYRCMAVTAATDGGVDLRCARSYGLCAAPIAFFTFDGTAATEAQLCDRATGTRGASLCSLPAGATQPARVDCYPYFPGTPEVGVCIAYCDLGVLETRADAQCGAGMACRVPLMPELYLPQSAQFQPCGVAAGCSGEYTCLDLGRGDECARPVRLCLPTP